MAYESGLLQPQCLVLESVWSEDWTYFTPQGGGLPEPGPVPQLWLESLHTHTGWGWVPEACKAEGVRRVLKIWVTSVGEGNYGSADTLIRMHTLSQHPRLLGEPASSTEASLC